MINLWMRGCLRFRTSSFQSIIYKPPPMPFDTRRCLCTYENDKQLTTQSIHSNKQIKGYFEEDFNVKGQTFWEISTRIYSGAIIYVALSTLTAFGSHYVMLSPIAVDLIIDHQLMDILSNFNLPDNINPRKALTLTLYFATEPFRILTSYALSKFLRNFLHSKRIIKDPKFKRFKDEKNYDEEKIGRF